MRPTQTCILEMQCDLEALFGIHGVEEKNKK
jgi:hypothetical protein